MKFTLLLFVLVFISPFAWCAPYGGSYQRKTANDGNLLYVKRNVGPKACVKTCFLHSGCLGVNYHTADFVCHLLSTIGVSSSNNGVSFTVIKYWKMEDDACWPNPCEMGEKCVVVKHNYPTCVKYDVDVKDCSELPKFSRSGVYTIYPENSKGIEVFCHKPSETEGWTVFQRRIDGSQNFYRSWDDYKNGFGDLNGEFWLGNENIHLLTKDGNNQLRIELNDWDSSTAYAQYSRFSISDALSNYQLDISGYTGTAGDGLSYSNNAPFSTKDKDNYNTNCPINCVGAWWYRHCTFSNLNGEYLNGKHNESNFHRGVVWYYWTGWKYSLKSSSMMIRKN